MHVIFAKYHSSLLKCCFFLTRPYVWCPPYTKYFEKFAALYISSTSSEEPSYCSARIGSDRRRVAYFQGVYETDNLQRSINSYSQEPVSFCKPQEWMKHQSLCNQSILWVELTRLLSTKNVDWESSLQIGLLLCS